MKTLCFRLYGDYGHFRPYYTTSSPTTYSLMPPTTIFGVLGAVLGLERKKNEYYHTLAEAGTKIGIGPVDHIRKMSLGINLINTKGNYWIPTLKNSNGPRTPTRYEYVVKPDYLIYVAMENTDLLDNLAARIEDHKPYYSVSLGLSELLGDFEFVFYKEANGLKNTDEFVALSSAVPLDLLSSQNAISVVHGISYAKERYVKNFLEDRVPGAYVDAIFSINGAKPLMKPDIAYEAENYIFTFLN